MHMNRKPLRFEKRARKRARRALAVCTGDRDHRRQPVLWPAEIVEKPEGRARIETYTVVHGREGVRMGIVIGRDAEDRRFVAQTPDDPAVLRDLESREGVGRTGVVGPHPDGVRNLFTPD